MPSLRKAASDDQALALAAHLYSAEVSLRRALVTVGGLRLRRAGQVADMVRRLQVVRLELGIERPAAGAALPTMED